MHCGARSSCDNVDWVKLIVDWVEKSKEPDQLVASKTVQGKLITKTIFLIQSSSGATPQATRYL
ncbi:MAG: tannase/feruloyl esterase family alpha/beta hydrolase [Saprospiraceae bacterium]|nr:tannase/feruloyl esterase family alpha/beta hydrolase [Saprospiraceae bacterium]